MAVGAVRKKTYHRRSRYSALAEISRRLERRYRSASLGNKANPLDELIYIQLSVRTPEGAYLGTWPALRRLVNGSWSRLIRLPERRIVQALRSGGMAGVKAKRLRGMVRAIKKRFGRVSLSPLKAMPDDEVEAFLRSLPGVGPKVARCVMMYSLGREVFPVDSHCRRVLTRLGFVPRNVEIKASHDFIQPIIPPHLRRPLHVNLIHHGRTVCTSSRPRCSECFLADLCPSARSYDPNILTASRS